MGIIEFLKTMSIRNKIKVISVFPLIFIIVFGFISGSVFKIDVAVDIKY